MLDARLPELTPQEEIDRLEWSDYGRSMPPGSIVGYAVILIFVGLLGLGWWLLF